MCSCRALVFGSDGGPASLGWVKRDGRRFARYLGPRSRLETGVVCAAHAMRDAPIGTAVAVELDGREAVAWMRSAIAGEVDGQEGLSPRVVAYALKAITDHPGSTVVYPEGDLSRGMQRAYFIAVAAMRRDGAELVAEVERNAAQARREMKAGK